MSVFTCLPASATDAHPCDYCTPCTCQCHRVAGVYHCMACCSICTECGQFERHQMSSAPPAEAAPCSG